MEYKINKDTVSNAKAPSLNKIYELALIGASIIVDDEDGIAVTNPYIAELYKMKVIACDYLQLFETSNIIDEATYEALNKINLLGRLNGLKRSENKTIGYKISEIIRKYELFLQMLNTEIKNELSRRNDIITRLNKDIETSITPENIQALADAQKNLLKKTEKKAE